MGSRAIVAVTAAAAAEENGTFVGPMASHFAFTASNVREIGF